MALDKTGDGQVDGSAAQPGGVNRRWRNHLVCPLYPLAAGVERRREHGLMRTAVLPLGAQLEQDVADARIGKRVGPGVRGLIQAMRARLTSAAEDGLRCRQVKIGQAQRFAAIEVDIDEPCRTRPEDDADVVAGAESPAELLGAKGPLVPTRGVWRFAAGRDRHDRPAPAVVFASGGKRTHGAASPPDSARGCCVSSRSMTACEKRSASSLLRHCKIV